MGYTIRTLHRGIWGSTGVDVPTRKEAKEFAVWGYKHYKKYRIRTLTPQPNRNL